MNILHDSKFCVLCLSGDETHRRQLIDRGWMDEQFRKAEQALDSDDPVIGQVFRNKAPKGISAPQNLILFFHEGCSIPHHRKGTIRECAGKYIPDNGIRSVAYARRD